MLAHLVQGCLYNPWQPASSLGSITISQVVSLPCVLRVSAQEAPLSKISPTFLLHRMLSSHLYWALAHQESYSFWSQLIPWIFKSVIALTTHYLTLCCLETGFHSNVQAAWNLWQPCSLGFQNAEIKGVNYRNGLPCTLTPETCMHAIKAQVFEGYLPTSTVFMPLRVLQTRSLKQGRQPRSCSFFIH